MAFDKSTSCHAARWLLASLTFVTTLVAAGIYATILRDQGSGLLWTAVLTALFAGLFVWIAFSFWMATTGSVRLLFRRKSEHAEIVAPHVLNPESRTAILMPIYNESPHRVFAGVRAIYESLRATGSGGQCDFFILSDSTNPDIWLAEEAAWARVKQTHTGESRIYYRHRPKNVARKSGNIADFCERWGSSYEYMVILDADSVMSGRTIIELIRRMQEDPRIGILQVPPQPVNRWSVFARCQQFAASVYSPIFLEGFQWWTGDDGNYWGHNAILRVDAFTETCGLPKLSGDGPLGGEILSHDFVEAALIRRAGYKVCLAADLDGSYEECPPTLITYAQRDQRWCQGNLQHVRLIASVGLRLVSRLHLTMGAMAYLASPLWLLSMALTLLTVLWPGVRVAESAQFLSSPSTAALALFGATMSMLLLPKLLSCLVLIADGPRRRACGGGLRVIVSTLIETIVSVLVAPIMMAFHTMFVITTLLGHRVQWNAQERDENGQGVRDAIAVHWKQTVLALLAGAALLGLSPGLLIWTAPILVGLVFAVPLSVILSSAALGRAFAHWGLLRIPEESSPPEVLGRHHHFLALPPPKEVSEPQVLFRKLLTDPAFLALHCCVLEATDSCLSAGAEVVADAKRQLLAGGPQRVSKENRKILLSDPAALDDLHLFVWTTQTSSSSSSEVERVQGAYAP